MLIKEEIEKIIMFLCRQIERQDQRVKEHYDDYNKLSNWGFRDRGYCEGASMAYYSAYSKLEDLIEEIGKNNE